MLQEKYALKVLFYLDINIKYKGVILWMNALLYMEKQKTEQI